MKGSLAKVLVKVQQYGPDPKKFQRAEKPLLTLMLRKTEGNQVRAANLLGINRNTLRKKIKELGIRGNYHESEEEGDEDSE